MVYSRQNAAFRRDKNQFFSQTCRKNLGIKTIESVEQRVQTIDYSFLVRHQNALETEFRDMFYLLQKQGKKNKEQFWLYCYYCASLLEHFHRAYAQENKAEEYKEKKDQIKNYLRQESTEQEVEVGFIASLYDSFVTSWKNVVRAPVHASRARDYIVYANLCRIYWLFNRLAFTQGLTVARDLQLIDKLDAVLGTHTDVDKIIAAVQAPTGVINYLSVGFFLARFLIDGGLLIKHTFFPSQLEKGTNGGAEVNKMARLPGAAHMEQYRATYILLAKGKASTLYYIPKQGDAIKLSGSIEQLKKFLTDHDSVKLSARQVEAMITKPCGHAPEKITRLERFKHELYKRHCNFANDLLWATVNFLCNFNHIVGISGPVTIYLTSAFLCFDVAMFFYKRQLAHNEYLTKKSQFLVEIAQYNDETQFSDMSTAQRLAHTTFLHKQLMELELNWNTKQATFYFLAAAAALLAMGFTVAMLLSPPLLSAGMLLVSLMAVAMYLSTDRYAAYKDKSLRLQQVEMLGEYPAVALKEYESARNAFIFALTKNTLAPLMLITTYAICWPAAVALTALYFGYELFHAYSQYQDNKAAQQLALAAPIEEYQELHCAVARG